MKNNDHESNCQTPTPPPHPTHPSTLGIRRGLGINLLSQMSAYAPLDGDDSVDQLVGFNNVNRKTFS
jgi:hypothetical protein